MDIFKTAIIAFSLVLLANVNTVSAAIITVNYSGTVQEVAGTAASSPASVGEGVSGSFIINTTEIASIDGDSTQKNYTYFGLYTYGLLNTQTNGSLGSNIVYLGIDNGAVLPSSSVIDDYFIGSFSDDLVWDSTLNRPTSGTQFSIRLAFPNDTFSDTSLDFYVLQGLSNPIRSGIWVAGYDASGKVYEAFSSLDSLNITISEVPVPPAVWLFGSGLIGFMRFVRGRDLKHKIIY